MAKNNMALCQNCYHVVLDRNKTVVPKPNDLSGRHNLRRLLLGAHNHLHPRIACGYANIPATLRQHKSDWLHGLSRKITKPKLKEMAKSEDAVHQTNWHAERNDGNADGTVSMELEALHKFVSVRNASVEVMGMRKHARTHAHLHVDLAKHTARDGPNSMGKSLCEMDNYHLAVRQICSHTTTGRSKAVAQ